MRAIEFILGDEADRMPPGPERQLLMIASQEIIGLRNRLAAAFRRNRKLEALEACGVDNWEGYSDAMSDIHSKDDSLED